MSKLSVSSHSAASGRFVAAHLLDLAHREVGQLVGVVEQGGLAMCDGPNRGANPRRSERILETADERGGIVRGPLPCEHRELVAAHPRHDVGTADT